MKKLLLSIGLLAITMATFAQSFSGPSTTGYNSTITLTAVGENRPIYGTSNYAYTYVNNNIYTTETEGISNTNPAIFGLVTIKITSIPSIYYTSGQPTTLQIQVNNPYVTPITVRFYIHTSYRIGITDYDQTIPYTLTVNNYQAPPSGGGGNPPVLGQSPDGTDGGVLTNYLWRLVRLSNNQHFYTRDRNELSDLVSARVLQNSNLVYVYHYEGALGYIYKSQQPGTVGLYRLLKNGDHMWSADPNEVNGLAGSGWTNEGITGYVYRTSQPNTLPVYRYVANGGSAGHFFTSDYNELGSGNSQWILEGVAYYLSSIEQ